MKGREGERIPLSRPADGKDLISPPLYDIPAGPLPRRHVKRTRAQLGKTWLEIRGPCNYGHAGCPLERGHLGSCRRPPATGLQWKRKS